jgi:voltage-gated potassium channel
MENQKENSITFLDLVIVILSLYVLFALIIDTYFRLPTELSKLLLFIDNIICIVFLFEFSYRFIKAPSKLMFLKWGWIDLVSSIPAFEFLRYGRLIRLFRILRILRAFRSLKHLSRHIFKNKVKGTFASVSLIAFLMIIFGSIAILQVEHDPNSNIKSAEDAIWWAFVTITTVGYGDKFPVTTEGRIIAGFLMITGVGLFGTFTGFIASWFLDIKQSNKNEDDVDEE